VSSAVTESTVEEAALAWLESIGWGLRHGPDIAPDTLSAERRDYAEVFLEQHLRVKFAYFPQDIFLVDIALRHDQLLTPPYTNMLFNNFTDDAEFGPRSGRVGFAGGAPGINGVLEMDFDTGYTVIVLSNYDPPVAVDLGAEIMGMLKK